MELSKIYRGCKKKGGRPSMTKKWFVSYYINGERERDYGTINEGTTIEEREERAKALKEIIDTELMEIHLNKKAVEAKKAPTVEEALRASMKEKTQTIAPGSVKEYTTPLKFFLEQTDIMDLSQIPITDLDRPTMKSIIHKMVEARHDIAVQKGKEYNKAYNFLKYKANINNLFETLLDDGIIKENPCSFKNPYRKPSPKLKILLDDDQRKAVREKITKEMPCFFPFCMIVMHTSMRPVEILRLRVHHISLKRREIFVYGDIAKNRRGRIVKIPDVLVPYIESIQLESFPGHYFAFGQEFIPEERDNPMREDKANRPWRKMVKDAPNEDGSGGLGIDSNLYHLKDLGMSTKIDADIHVDAVKHLAGHASIEQSMVYMRPEMKAEINRKRAEESKKKIAAEMEKLMKNAVDF